MKGVVLAGGLGTRFHPITKVVNKHLLDVFDRPMIHYPIMSLVQAGLEDLTIVTGQELEQFRSLLGDGSDFGIKLSFAQQIGEGGIADALRAAQTSVGTDPVVVILGDNIFQDDLSPYIDAFQKSPHGARILLKRTAIEDAKRFGVATVNGEKVVRVVEKPAEPESDLVVTGCYMYDNAVFDVIASLEPSARNEYEITDVNNHYIRSGSMAFDVLKGWWTDTGTPPSKLKASILVALNKGVTFHA